MKAWFTLIYDENGMPQYYLWETITEQNKEELKITFDKLFAEADMECYGAIKWKGDING